MRSFTCLSNASGHPWNYTHTSNIHLIICLFVCLFLLWMCVCESMWMHVCVSVCRICKEDREENQIFENYSYRGLWVDHYGFWKPRFFERVESVLKPRSCLPIPYLVLIFLIYDFIYGHVIVQMLCMWVPTVVTAMLKFDVLSKKNKSYSGKILSLSLSPVY